MRGGLPDFRSIDRRAGDLAPASSSVEWRFKNFLSVRCPTYSCRPAGKGRLDAATCSLKTSPSLR
jgi:hypothetical protein